MSTGMKGTAFYPSGNSPRTRDWSRPKESEKSETVKPTSDTEKLADLYLAQHERWKGEAEADERTKLEAQRQRRLQEQRKIDERHQLHLREQAEETRKRARGQWEMNERLIDSCLTKFSQPLTQAERDAVMQALLDGDSYTAERCEMLCAEAAAKKQQANEARIAEIKSLCDADEWERILRTIVRYRSHFTEAEIASGEAHRIVRNRFRS